MRLIGFILLLFALFPSISSAEYTYIKVTKTKSINQLKYIKLNLKKMGQSTTHRTTETNYILYSGPYKNTQNAQYALNKIKRYFPYALIVKTKTKPKPKLKTKSKNKIKKQNQINYINQKNSFFISGSFGYAGASLTQTGNVDIYVPKESGMSYDLHGGYNFKNNVFLTIGYLRTDSSEIVFDNFYGSTNYKFGPYGDYSPYFGLLAGYSKLTWNKNPLDNTNANNSSGSFFGGTQIGAIYKGFEKLSLFINYQCLFLNHTTTVNTLSDSSELKHRTLRNIQIGVQYSF